MNPPFLVIQLPFNFLRSPLLRSVDFEDWGRKKTHPGRLGGGLNDL